MPSIYLYFLLIFWLKLIHDCYKIINRKDTYFPNTYNQLFYLSNSAANYTDLFFPNNFIHLFKFLIRIGSYDTYFLVIDIYFDIYFVLKIIAYV